MAGQIASVNPVGRACGLGFKQVCTPVVVGCDISVCVSAFFDLKDPGDVAQPDFIG